SSGPRTATGKFKARPTSLSLIGSSSGDDAPPHAASASTPSAEDGEIRSDRVGESDRCRTPHLDRAAVVPGRSIPYSVGEYGKHAARRRFPVRQQGGIR